MFCKHCGNSIDNDSKFCSFCGGKVSSIEVANEKRIFLGKAHVEKLYFKKLTFPNAAEEWATIEKWITKEVLSDDIAL